MPKHYGKFKWKKYTRYNGNLRDYWTDRDRQPEHLKEGDGRADRGRDPQVSP